MFFVCDSDDEPISAIDENAEYEEDVAEELPESCGGSDRSNAQEQVNETYTYYVDRNGCRKRHKKKQLKQLTMGAMFGNGRTVGYHTTVMTTAGPRQQVARVGDLILPESTTTLPGVGPV